MAVGTRRTIARKSPSRSPSTSPSPSPIKTRRASAARSKPFKKEPVDYDSLEDIPIKNLKTSTASSKTRRNKPDEDDFLKGLEKDLSESLDRHIQTLNKHLEIKNEYLEDLPPSFSPHREVRRVKVEKKFQLYESSNYEEYENPVSSPKILNLHENNIQESEKENEDTWDPSNERLYNETKVKTEPSFQCTYPHCEKELASKKSLKRHLMNIHEFELESENEDNWEPSIERSFELTKVKSEYKTKVKTEQKFNCTYEECGKELSSKKSLKRHLRNIHEVKRENYDVSDYDESKVKTELKLRCTYEDCEKLLSSSWSLSRHIKNIHESDRPYKETNNDISIDGKFQCTYEDCGKELSSRRSLRRHLQSSIHEPRTEDDEVLEKNIECSECDYKTNRKSYLDRHFRDTHEKPKDVCYICNYQSARKEKMRQHIRFYHDKIYDHKCNYCSYCAITKEKLKRHTKAVHEKIKDIQCDICSFSTATAYNLRIHVQTQHIEGRQILRENNNQDRVPCTLCTSSLASAKGLRHHMRDVHKDGQPKEDGNSKMWRMNRDPLDNYKEYKCSYETCESEFSAKRTLARHIKKFHEQKSENDDEIENILYESNYIGHEQRSENDDEIENILYESNYIGLIE